MTRPVAVSARAANDVRSILEQTQRLQDALRTYVEALGAALDVPRDWRFDMQTMAFVPPPTAAEGSYPPDGDAD